MARDLTLLGALVATGHVLSPDAFRMAEFLDHVDVQYDAPPATLESAIDMALSFFEEDPDTEAQKVQERVQAAHETHDDGRGVCPDCGEPSMMDSVDDEMSVDLWLAVRNVVDKYMWDQMQMHDHGEAEEC